MSRLPNARAELERGSLTPISTSPITAVVNTLYKAGHGEVRPKASVEQRHGSSLHPLLPLHVGCLAKFYWYFLPNFFSFFFSSHLLCSPFLFRSILGVAKARSHMVSSTLPSPLRYAPCIFYRENNSALFSLVDSRRIVPTHALVGALDSWVSFENEKLHTENS